MSDINAATAPTAAVETVHVTAKKPKKGFSFGDFIDVINPLHHIPVVGTVYRAITGDKIRPEAKIAGGAVFGGFIGMGVAMADAIVETETGKDAGQHVASVFKSDKSAKTAVAAAPAAKDDVKLASTRKAEALSPIPVFPAMPAGAVTVQALADDRREEPAKVADNRPTTSMGPLPVLTEEQLYALGRTFGTATGPAPRNIQTAVADLPLPGTRNDDAARKDEDKPRPDLKAAYAERRVAYDQALQLMAQGLDKYHALDSIPR